MSDQGSLFETPVTAPLPVRVDPTMRSAFEVWSGGQLKYASPEKSDLAGVTLRVRDAGALERLGTS